MYKGTPPLLLKMGKDTVAAQEVQPIQSAFGLPIRPLSNRGVVVPCCVGVRVCV